MTAIFLHRRAGLEDVVVASAGRCAQRHLASHSWHGVERSAVAHDAAGGMTVADVIELTSRRMKRGAGASTISDWLTFVVTSARALRQCFGLSLNVMPFKYDFGFGGTRVIAHNLSLGPVEDLSISVYDRSDRGPLRIDFDANPARYSAADLADHQQRFLGLLAGAVAAPDRSLGLLDVLSDAERATILSEWNETARRSRQRRCRSCSPRRPRAARTRWR